MHIAVDDAPTALAASPCSLELQPIPPMPEIDGFELQERDVELLHFVHQLRIATIDHLSALSGRSVRALWGRLHKLRKRHDLSTAARFMQKHVYAIGSQGIPVLTEHGYAPGELAAKRPRHRELSEIGIRHSLFIADIHIRVLLLTRTGPITLTHWEEGSSLWDTARRVDSEPAMPVRPDAYFVLNHAARPDGKNAFHVFLEADRSTMSHERMAGKVRAYVAYYEQQLYARKFDGVQEVFANEAPDEARGAPKAEPEGVSWKGVLIRP